MGYDRVKAGGLLQYPSDVMGKQKFPLLVKL